MIHQWFQPWRNQKWTVSWSTTTHGRSCFIGRHKRRLRRARLVLFPRRKPNFGRKPKVRKGRKPRKKLVLARAGLVRDQIPSLRTPGKIRRGSSRFRASLYDCTTSKRLLAICRMPRFTTMTLENDTVASSCLSLAVWGTSAERLI